MKTSISRTAWLTMRKKGIGASDSSAILGLSPYTTALEVYTDKVGTLKEVEAEHKTMGNIMEPVIAKLYAKKRGVTLQKPIPVHVHPEHEWFRASLDYVYENGNCIVECKNSRTPVGWGEEGTDEVPKLYWIQAQHQMAVSGIDFCDIAVLIGGQDFRIYSINKDKSFCELLIQVLRDFWFNHVLPRIPPEPDWEHPSTHALMGRIHTEITDNVIELGWAETRQAKEIIFLQETEKEARKQINELKGKLRHAIGDARAATLQNGWTIARNQISRGSYVVDATTYIDMRIKQNTKKKGK